MGTLMNSSLRVRPSSKFAHTVDRVQEYHTYIGILALFITRVQYCWKVIGGKYYKIHRLRRSFIYTLQYWIYVVTHSRRWWNTCSILVSFIVGCVPVCTVLTNFSVNEVRILDHFIQYGFDEFIEDKKSRRRWLEKSDVPAQSIQNALCRNKLAWNFKQNCSLL